MYFYTLVTCTLEYYFLVVQCLCTHWFSVLFAYTYMYIDTYMYACIGTMYIYRNLGNFHHKTI